MPTVILDKLSNGHNTLPPSSWKKGRRGDGQIVLLLPGAVQALALADTFGLLDKWEAPVVICRHTARFLSMRMPQLDIDDEDTQIRKSEHNAAADAVRAVLDDDIPFNIAFMSCFDFQNQSYTFQTPENASVRTGKGDSLPHPLLQDTATCPLSFMEHERMVHHEVVACLNEAHAEMVGEQVMFLHGDDADGQLVPARLDIDVAAYDATLVKPLALDAFYFKNWRALNGQAPKGDRHRSCRLAAAALMINGAIDGA